MTISANFRESAYASETGRVPILLITIDHPDMPAPIYISTDPTERILELDEVVIYGTVSRGINFIFMPMRFKLPDDSDAGPGTMQIELDNVDRALTQTIRDIHTPIPFKVEMVMDNAKDTVDLVWPEYVLVNIQYNAATISGTLTLDNLVREPFPGLMFTPGTAKGVFL